jgi:hypothetical protein
MSADEVKIGQLWQVYSEAPSKWIGVRVVRLVGDRVTLAYTHRPPRQLTVSAEAMLRDPQRYRLVHDV